MEIISIDRFSTWQCFQINNKTRKNTLFFSVRIQSLYNIQIPRKTNWYHNGPRNLQFAAASLPPSCFLCIRKCCYISKSSANRYILPSNLDELHRLTSSRRQRFFPRLSFVLDATQHTHIYNSLPLAGFDARCHKQSFGLFLFIPQVYYSFAIIARSWIVASTIAALRSRQMRSMRPGLQTFTTKEIRDSIFHSWRSSRIVYKSSHVHPVYLSSCMHFSKYKRKTLY